MTISGDGMDEYPVLGARFVSDELPELYAYAVHSLRFTTCSLYFTSRQVHDTQMPVKCHTTLNRHMCVMTLRNDPLCSACGEEEETAFHFPGRYPAGMQHRYSIFGSYLLELDELSKVDPLSLIRFVRTTKRLL